MARELLCENAGRTLKLCNDMSGAEQQIITQYDTLGMSVEEIAETTGLHAGAIEAVLNSYSQRRREVAKDAEFSGADEELALSVVRRVAQYSEDDNTALKAAMYIRNDKKGRLNPRAVISGLKLNVQELNVHFQQAAKALAAAVQPKQTTIDVHSTTSNP